ncbi:Tetratricopeptide repeat-containing protein [Thermophagus xiamenensis]|uniref:Tetratricopeptide repeat-containing protein n=1 Tax=Thermophagus xiamenensis TaxID=385682 RepID=A0A1I1V844_9BACT|nr:Tetratricopeptide repeat-containing protein [Thermophagus xiamenensis]
MIYCSLCSILKGLPICGQVFNFIPNGSCLKYCRSLVFIVCLVFYFFKTDAQNFDPRDSLQQVLRLENNDSVKVLLLLELAKLSDGRPFDGFLYARDALQLAEKNGYHVLKARALENISLFHRKLGNYSDAVEASFKALQVYDELGLWERKADLQLQIGTHLSNDKNFQKAIPYITMALNSFRERADTFRMALALINLGETYRLNGNTDSAEYCFTECLQWNTFLDNRQIEGYATGNLGMVFLDKEKPDSAIVLLKRALDILEGMGDAYSVSVYLSEMGKAYILKGKKNEGENIFKSALELAKNERLKEQIRDMSKYLSEFYEKNGVLD